MEDEGKAVTSPFDAIRHLDGDREFWRARELSKILGYDRWENFELAIQRAITMCTLAKLEPSVHFSVTSKTVSLSQNAKREIRDYYLTRYALHLVLICSDKTKSETAQALVYLTLTSLDSHEDYYALAKKLGISVSDQLDMTKEQRTIRQIRTAFKHLQTIQQYRVGPYYIDLYFPDHAIAVECDEDGHCGYSQTAECKRQKYIERTLNCRFVRYNPDPPNFNISDVINQIIQLIYSEE
jgi:very-short-patch-repair endonuclease